MKKGLLFFTIVFIFNSVVAQNKTWVGANGANWNLAGNWSPAAVPTATDTVIFNSANACNVDINPAIASLRAIGAGGNLISSAAVRTISINNFGASSPVLFVATGASLSLGNGGFGVSISTWSPGGETNNAQVNGSMFFGFASTWVAANGPMTAITNIDVSGTIMPVTIHTGPLFSNTSIATLRFLSGSILDWDRNGGNIPDANYQNGSTINVHQITNTMVAFSASSNYNGLVIWNCPGQTISGSAAVLLPTASYLMDSIRVVNTNSGSLRLFTEPNGYTLGHIEVQGGILQMSAPLIGNKTGTITTDLKITGGTVIGNASFVGEGLVGFAMTLSVGGQFIMTGGTLDLTNRPVGVGANGAFQLNVAGDVSQTAGTITATSSFGSQNQILLNGTTAQNLTMSTFSGPMALVTFNTSTAGITLLSPLTIPALPSALVLIDGVLRTTTANLLTMSAGSAVFGASDASFVDGPVRKIGNTAFTFPVGDVSGIFTGYVPIEISAPSLNTDAFTAQYIRSSAITTFGSTYTTGLDHVSSADHWILEQTTGTSTPNVTLYWTAASSNGGSPNYITDLNSLVIAHSTGTVWDNFGGLGSIAGGSTQTAGSITWTGVPTFGPFSLGSINFANPLPVELNYLNGFKQNGTHLLNWKVTCNNNAEATMTLERSADKQNFTAISTVKATALRCQQPFDHTDLTPLTGINYYRLKMVDANGKITYSAIIALLNKSTGFEIVNLLPTVVNNNAILNITAAQKIKMDIVITDITGRQVQKIAYNLIAGSNQFTLNLAGLGAGTYQITGYTADEKSKTIRFVKQ